MKYARIENNVVQEIFIKENGRTLENSFHPQIALLFTEIEANVFSGYELINGVWTAPPEPITEEPVVEDPAV